MNYFSGPISLDVCHVPVLQVPNERQRTLRFEDSRKFLGSFVKVWAPMQCLPTTLDSWFSSEWLERTHLSYYDEIRPTIFSVDPFESSFRNRRTIIFRLPRKYGSHPGTGVVRFQ